MARPGRTVVRTYGRDSLLGLVNPLLALIVRMFGVQLRLKSEDRVLLEMERDQVAMIRKGYRIAASEQFEMPPFGITWYRVTYEAVDPTGRPAASAPPPDGDATPRGTG
jgi:hypothetical protein